MPEAMIKFGRLVRNVSTLALPLNLAADAENVDVDEQGSCTRRKGYIRLLDNAYTTHIELLVRVQDRDGTLPYIVIDRASVNRDE